MEVMTPKAIENKSFEIITELLGDRIFLPDQEGIIKRVIHTTADLEYANSLYFSEGVVSIIQTALREGTLLVTDTKMARAGINERLLKKYGSEMRCFISDEDVTREALTRRITRATAAVEKAFQMDKPLIFVVGNAPTALLQLLKMIGEGASRPLAVIGAPVGFVNVVEAKDQLMASGIPCIVPRGRKGGSNVAAAIVNAIAYGCLDAS
ncbi:MAG: precorrin-8X methylmutase [Clostridiales bacterium]|jgi:precorrin-8X/cobalt-precorrin-8 methylmutase|nr:precorrin-8X methylmutase [Clostridiales bacterium]